MPPDTGRGRLLEKESACCGREGSPIRGRIYSGFLHKTESRPPMASAMRGGEGSVPPSEKNLEKKGLMPIGASRSAKEEQSVGAPGKKKKKMKSVSELTLVLVAREGEKVSSLPVDSKVTKP